MRTTHALLAAVMAATLLPVPAAAQDTTRKARAVSQKAVRARTVSAQTTRKLRPVAQKVMRARAVGVQTTQGPETQQARERAQRLARLRAQRQREDAQRQERQRAQRLRAQQQRDAARNWPAVTESFTQTIRLGRNGTFDLQNAAGNITVNGGSGDEVRIDAIKSVRHRQESTARVALPQIRINVTERAGNVEVRTEQPRRGNAIWSVDYTVAVPRGATVVLQTVSGDVRVTNISGELRAQSVSGSITAASVERVRQLRSVSGTIDLADSESDELTAHTLGGDVLVRNLKGRVLDLQTVTGDARLIDVEVERARLESMSGDLDYSGRLAQRGRYEFRTHSGDIRISPSGNPGFELQAASFNGALRSEYVLKTAPDDARPANQSLNGTFGNASAALTAQSFSGDILILKR
jgi:DUF4097 and DUF4098 domain-containing protein YvlB